MSFIHRLKDWRNTSRDVTGYNMKRDTDRIDISFETGGRHPFHLHRARVGAILDLTWDRVHFETGIIDLRLSDGITRKGRSVVPMNRMARNALESACEARLTDFVIAWAGHPVKSIRTGYKAAMERAGLSDMHLHQIRHTVAVKMLQAGRPLAEVSQFLGHSNTQITEQTYARFTPERFSTAAEILDLPGFNEPDRTSQNRYKELILLVGDDGLEPPTSSV